MEPLYTEQETQDWKRRISEAEADGDPRTAWKRRVAVQDAWGVDRLQRLSKRPGLLVDFLLVVAYGRGSVPVDYRVMWREGAEEMIKAADNSTNRRLVHTMLEAFKHIPQSWATSAATRFFRGTGVQAKAPWRDRVGAGILASSQGFKQVEATAIVSAFYKFPVGSLIMPDDSVDPYAESSYEIDEEGGNRFAATRKERDEEMINNLQGILEERGLGAEIVLQSAPAPKARKAKTFAPGDKVTSRNVRDLPDGSHIQWRYTRKERNRKMSRWEEYEVVFDGVYVGKVRNGLYSIRPVQKAIAFSPMDTSSTRLFENCEYLGPWDGEVVEVEVMAHKPTSNRKVKR